jgi:hypothetical protein
MPRPLLEIWRELNRDRDRDRGPSSLLQASIGRKPSSFVEQAIADVKRDMNRKPPSFTEQAIADGRQTIADRVLGTPRPVSPVRPDRPAQPGKRKRRPGGGRHHSLTPDEFKKARGILSRYPGISVDAARKTLEEAGIKISTSTVYRLFFKPASDRS